MTFLPNKFVLYSLLIILQTFICRVPVCGKPNVKCHSKLCSLLSNAPPKSEHPELKLQVFNVVKLKEEFLCAIIQGYS